MERLKPGLNALSILGLLFTLIVMFSAQGRPDPGRPGIVLEMAVPMALFFAVMFFVVLFIGSRLRFPYRDVSRSPSTQLDATSRSPSPSPSRRSRPRSLLPRWLAR